MKHTSFKRGLIALCIIAVSGLAMQTAAQFTQHKKTTEGEMVITTTPQVHVFGRFHIVDWREERIVDTFEIDAERATVHRQVPPGSYIITPVEGMDPRCYTQRQEETSCVYTKSVMLIRRTPDAPLTHVMPIRVRKGKSTVVMIDVEINPVSWAVGKGTAL